jgi:hypothetical protein
MPLDLYRTLQLCLAITNDLSLAIGITRINQKGILMQLGHQSNSYDLMLTLWTPAPRELDLAHKRVVYDLMST